VNGASADPSPGSEKPCAPSARLTAALPVNRYGGSFDDADRLAAFLGTCGFGVSAAAAKARLLARCAAALRARDGAPPENGHAYFVPGRIEVLGKHTDYAGGSSLVAAAEPGFCLIAVAASDPWVRVADAIRGETIQFAMDSELVPPPGHWANYPLTVARRLVRNFPGATRGAQIALASDLPPAAGMSSSSALLVAIAFALADANDIWSHERFLPELNEPLNLAGYLATIENGQSYGPLAGDRGVGTFGGSEDHTAILCARPGFIRQYAYCPVRFQRQMPLPADWTFAIASCGVAAEKTGAALEQYNRASRLAAVVADLWRRETRGDAPHLAAAVRSQADAAERLRAILAGSEHGEFRPRELLDRLEHFLIENEQVIPAAGAALAGGDLETFGRWVDRSQRAAETLLGNQIPETVYLAAAAREHGAAAASAFGAGFGGSVWALVPTGRVAEFLAQWRRSYLDRFPQHESRAVFFPTAAGPALCRVNPVAA
jgi:galactokinase